MSSALTSIIIMTAKNQAAENPPRETLLRRLRSFSSMPVFQLVGVEAFQIFWRRHGCFCWLS